MPLKQHGMHLNKIITRRRRHQVSTVKGIVQQELLGQQNHLFVMDDLFTKLKNAELSIT
jgi:hypothetical protein